MVEYTNCSFKLDTCTQSPNPVFWYDFFPFVYLFRDIDHSTSVPGELKLYVHVPKDSLCWLCLYKRVKHR